MQTPRKISLPGRHCHCGALRAGASRRCEKCQARAGWYRHNCRRPWSAASPTQRLGVRWNADTPARSKRSAEEG